MKASEEAQDDREAPSVLDFLYHDSQRVASFLSQFDACGHPTGIKQTEANESGLISRADANASAGLAVVRAAGSFEDQNSIGEREQSEWAYDPIWSNAIELLGQLDSKGLIERDIARANIGQFVLVSGALAVLDYSLIQLIWDNDLLRTSVEDSMSASFSTDLMTASDRNIGGRNSKVAVNMRQEARKQAKAAIDFIRKPPHTHQRDLRTRKEISLRAVSGTRV